MHRVQVLSLCIPSLSMRLFPQSNSSKKIKLREGAAHGISSLIIITREIEGEKAVNTHRVKARSRDPCQIAADWRI